VGVAVEDGHGQVVDERMSSSGARVSEQAVHADPACRLQETVFARAGIDLANQFRP
jgi:hypothetical protein